jgi:sugar transferase (PEP-CTERM system associated)
LFSLSRPKLSAATLFQFAAELAWLFLAIVIVLHAAGQPLTEASTTSVALLFAATLVCLNGLFGLYQSAQALPARSYLLRAILAPAIGIPLALLATQLLPGVAPLHEDWALAILLAFAGLLLIRHAVVLPLVVRLLPHRVLVLGTGPEARLVEASLALNNPLGTRLVGFYGVERPQDAAVAPSRVIAKSASLEEVVRQLSINEIIIAVRQQRGGVLPLRSLLNCRISGVQITDLAGYFERVHGQVPIEALKVSWLIYGHGFRQSAWRNTVKRSFDLAASLALIIVALPLATVAALLIAAEGGGPVIYRQQRVGLHGRVFTVYKMRTMAQDAEKDGKAAWAAVNDARVTRVGRLLRLTRVDELPQLLNVLKGEMSFVGPRPERPEFVAMLTEQIPFYEVRHSVKPGLTGWAQVRYSYGATVEQSIRKLEYDLYYVKNHTLVLDLLILFETMRVVLLGEGAR